ncbi:SIR2 family protein [Cetobacterium sp. SF1]|uniref:SIR2 family protein n=1 Tax=Cetobacterium sp. SF1 TaxID=3417654 RepID=UPI003CF0DED4
MSILDELIQNNEFPIIFIGAGISKRYLDNYPSWLDLLEKIWNEVETKDFYSELNLISDELKKTYTDEKEREFYVNIKMASAIENIVKKKHNNGSFKIDNLTPRDVYMNKINPLKKKIANLFKNYQVNKNNDTEIKEFMNMLKKARIILTTNYDTFIEDYFEQTDKSSLMKYIGQKGLFQSENRYCELYKIHGCINDSNSITITEEDYREYNQNSILITSKIISSLLNSPIIFIGYSLTDLNIRNIIKSFSNSLNLKEREKLSKRMIVIDWKKKEKKLVETSITDPTLNCSYTLIETDNYLEIYKKIAKINQGATPAEISKFEHIIKELIIQKGKKGELDKTIVNLVPKENLEDFLKDIGNQNIAVAIGDRTIIVKSLSAIDYLKEYIEGTSPSNLEVNLRFLAQQNISSIFPSLKYLNENNINNSLLFPNAKNKLKKYLEKLKKFNIINSSYKDIVEYKTINEIKEFANNKKVTSNLKAELDVIQDSLINTNIKNFTKEDIEKYILDRLEKMNIEKNEKISTDFRKLLINYDLKYNLTT